MAQKGINKVILVGNLGQDPETRFFPDGGAITHASLATGESWKDREGQQQERTEWHRLVFKDMGNRKLGQWAGESLTKGTKLYVEGKLQTRKWQDKGGVDHYTTEVIVNEYQHLSPRDQQAPPVADRGHVAPSTAATHTPIQPSPGYTEEQASFYDDIPF